MKNSNIIFISVLILAFGGYYAYKKLQDSKKISKKEAILIIVGNGFHKNENNFLETFEENFLFEWIKAIKDGKSTFIYNGKNYLTNGGKLSK